MKTTMATATRTIIHSRRSFIIPSAERFWLGRRNPRCHDRSRGRRTHHENQSGQCGHQDGHDNPLARGHCLSPRGKPRVVTRLPRGRPGVDEFTHRAIEPDPLTFEVGLQTPPTAYTVTVPRFDKLRVLPCATVRVLAHCPPRRHFPAGRKSVFIRASRQTPAS